MALIKKEKNLNCGGVVMDFMGSELMGWVVSQDQKFEIEFKAYLDQIIVHMRCYLTGSKTVWNFIYIYSK